jgi:hypothetical protein
MQRYKWLACNNYFTEDNKPVPKNILNSIRKENKPANSLQKSMVDPPEPSKEK